MARHITVQQRAGGHHLGIQQGPGRQQAMEIAAVPVGPVHHRGDTYSVHCIYLILFYFHLKNWCDLCIVCDVNKLDEQGCVGAPDLAVEILSPGNSRREMRDKYQLYEEAGIREYWIVNPQEKVVLVYVLNEQGVYVGKAPVTEEDVLRSDQFAGLEIAMKEVFKD